MVKKATIIHQNVQSIGICVNRLEKFLHDFPDCIILCVTEHWKTETQLTNYGIADFYLAEAVCRQVENQHGGTAIFVRHSINFKRLSKITELSKLGICECSACEFNINGEKTIVLCLYTPGGVVDDFLSCLERILVGLVSFIGHIILESIQ
ncbi:uncharacterized protein LOC123321968 isoform X2 [Coccinella septempunctata]|uniref:uncharacterized protein LOC123321968 isoform X2 n=1 Tax=Coccinella septempunctata TaxID=41139 RepID=UPI001D061266|nr:uncharacterized protein LOC123321968 isoform X2 [Coccinella septempunctata]